MHGIRSIHQIQFGTKWKFHYQDLIIFEMHLFLHLFMALHIFITTYMYAKVSFNF